MGTIERPLLVPEGMRPCARAKHLFPWYDTGRSGDDALFDADGRLPFAVCVRSSMECYKNMQSIASVSLFVFIALTSACEESKGCAINSDCTDGACCLITDADGKGVCLPTDVNYEDDSQCGAACTVSADCVEGESCYSPEGTGCAGASGICAATAGQIAQLCE